MKIYVNKKYTTIPELNEITVTGRIIECNKANDYGDSLTCIYPFNAPNLLPFKMEVLSPSVVMSEDGSEEPKKYIMNVNLYQEIADKIAADENFFVGCRVRVKGQLMSKNYLKTEEKKNIMNFCNRYKNTHDGEKPVFPEPEGTFRDKDTGEEYGKFFIDWEKLLLDGLIQEIPEEDAQETGKVEYFVLEDGRAFRTEQKTNYTIIGAYMEKIDDYVDTNKGDENIIVISGKAKDIYVYNHETYASGHICVVNKIENLSRNNYIHASLKNKTLDVLGEISVDDFVRVKGKLKHRVIEKTEVIKKGKKEIEKTRYTNIYEIDCKELEIYKSK